MAYPQPWLTVSLLALTLLPHVSAQSPACAAMTPGQLTSLNGFVPFPTSLWNTDISSMPVDPDSSNLIKYIGASAAVHPDFGSGLYDGTSIGIPYQIVAGTQAKVNIQLKAYASESDPGPEPIPSNALIEGYPKPGDGDRHVLVLDKDDCWLYEMGSAYLTNGQWSANVTTVWDMNANEQRPYTWTSADAAGLSISQGWPAMTRLRKARSTTRCVSRCRRRAKPLLHRRRIGPPRSPIRMHRRWECGCG